MESRMKQLRKDRKLSQVALGTRLGISQQNISKYEKNAYTIPLDVLISVAKYFRVSVDYLLGLSDMKYVLELTPVDRSYEIAQRYKGLSKGNQRLLDVLMNEMEELSIEKDRET